MVAHNFHKSSTALALQILKCYTLGCFLGQPCQLARRPEEVVDPVEGDAFFITK